MSKRYTRPLTPPEIAAIQDRDIDFDEVPDLGAAFWSQAEIVRPDRTQPVTLRVKTSVLEAFKADGKGYQSRMNAVLESYVRSTRKPPRNAAG